LFLDICGLRAIEVYYLQTTERFLDINCPPAEQFYCIQY